MLIGILLKINLCTPGLLTPAVHGDVLDLFSLADAPVPEVTFIASALAFISEDLLEAQCTQEDSESDPVNQMTKQTDKSMGGFFFCCFCFAPFFSRQNPQTQQSTLSGLSQTDAIKGYLMKAFGPTWKELSLQSVLVPFLGRCL